MSRPTYAWQRGLWAFNGVLFLPATGATAGTGLGTTWTSGGTVSHPAPTSGSTGAQLKRTAFTQVVTTANQELGVRSPDAQFHYGTAVGRGGWYHCSVFRIEAWFNNTGRLFVGMADPAAGSIAALVELAGVTAAATNVIGLYHDGNDGANVLSLLSAAGGAATKTAIAGATLAAGSAFCWEMWCFPGTSTYNWRLSSLGATGPTKIVWSTGGAPAAGTFLGPQCQMSNGASDVTAGHFALGIANIYAEPVLAL